MIAHVPRPGELYLDHVSHFVPDLDAAARALCALGFVVTPRSDQRTQDGPAGTSNVCAMLERGYLEFLAPTADTPNAARLRAAMARHPGVHLCCFGTPAAEEEHARLAAHGFAPQPIVSLERDTETGRARFKVVRPAPETMPEGRVQFVEHLTPEVLWHPRWMGHANGVRALACAFVVARDPVEAAARWAEFAALLPRPARRFVHLPADRGHVLVGTRVEWRPLLGEAVPEPPALAGCALECDDPAALAARAERAGCAVRRLRRALYALALPPALGGFWVVGTRKSLAMDD
ncbi:MAG: VOC family protein [Burkholderiales bacterium]|nr:VOC family protein [Burkholderiales bacterium]